MIAAYSTVPFSSLDVGQVFYLTNSLCNELYGPYTKTPARQCEQSRRFYAGEVPGYPSKSDFHGWNCTRPDWNGDRWIDSEWSLAPETPCVLRPEGR